MASGKISLFGYVSILKIGYSSVIGTKNQILRRKNGQLDQFQKSKDEQEIISTGVAGYAHEKEIKD